MSHSKMHISVIIPTRNRAELLEEAIRSVLAQQGDGLEIIVVDDDSSDQTDRIAQAFGPAVRYVHQEHAGPAAARNHGLRLSSGGVVGFLDDDDLWAQDKLGTQQPCLLNDPGTDIVLGHTQRMIWRENAPGDGQFVDYRKPVKLYSLGCALFRRSVFDRVGLFDEKMQHAEDDDWFIRAKSLDVGMLFLPHVSQYYRFHENNMTYDRQAKSRDLLRLFKNRIDRQRSA